MEGAAARQDGTQLYKKKKKRLKKGETAVVYWLNFIGA